MQRPRSHIEHKKTHNVFNTTVLLSATSTDRLTVRDCQSVARQLQSRGLAPQLTMPNRAWKSTRRTKCLSMTAYIITLCVFGFCPSLEAESCVHCSFRACVFTATSVVLLPSCARHSLPNSVSYTFADQPTCIQYPINSFVRHGVEYCCFLTFIVMADRDSEDRDLEESEVSEPTLSEAAIGLADIFGMTVDELRGEVRVRSIPYAGLTKVELRWLHSKIVLLWRLTHKPKQQLTVTLLRRILGLRRKPNLILLRLKLPPLMRINCVLLSFKSNGAV